jgi:uncharacterized protein YqjF (DUF2071 family)
MNLFPTITGIIDRRILINYRIDARALANYLPQPFEPHLVEGHGIAGICLIRLKHIRPKGFPTFIGLSSENGAHRIAVKWKEHGEYRYGVYIPRRDTSSRLNVIASKTVFPSVHYYSPFSIQELGDEYQVSFKNQDGTYLAIQANTTSQFNSNSIFSSIEEVSTFFEEGNTGFSPHHSNCYDELELNTYSWHVQPMEVETVTSSFFENESIFPKGSVVFDNALLMKNIEHEWVMKGRMEV